MRSRISILCALCAVFVLPAPRGAFATFHLMRITEVCTGLAGDETVQFLELVTLAAGQNLTNGQIIDVRNADGSTQTTVFTFPSNFGTGAAGEKILIATTNFAALAGITPDFTFAGGLPRGSGMILLFPDAGSDSLSYGNYTGPGDFGATGNAPANTGAGTVTLQRTSNTGNDANDYTLVENAPRNFANALGHLVPPTLSDPGFDLGGAGWTIETAGSGSVQFGLSNIDFSSDVARLTAFTTSGAGIAQQIPGFTTTGQEFQLVITPLSGSSGNLRAGFRTIGGAVSPSLITHYLGGQTNARTIKSDDPTHPVIYIEKEGAVGGINEVDSMAVTQITAAPTYGGPAGLLTAVRASATSANLTWNLATDNITPSGQIVYNVYYSAAPGTILQGGIRTTFTGVTAGTVTGLPNGVDMYFIVRAADRVGNEEGNTSSILMGPEPLAAPDWQIFE